MSDKLVFTILVVDDSPEDRHTYTSYMQEYDDCIITMLEASDAEEGLRILKQVQVDCTLLDYELPDMSGLDFLTRMQAEPASQTVPVVMITGRGSEHVAVEAMKTGAVDYIVKSKISRESLYRALRNGVERSVLLRNLQAQTHEREHAEAELRDSESRFRLLVGSVTEYAIIMLDESGNITSWNAGARQLLNYHDHEVIGRHVRVLFTPQEASNRLPEAELTRADSGAANSVERRFTRKGGDAFWASAVFAPIIDGAGSRCGYSLILRDMTERRHAQSQLDASVKTHDDFVRYASHQLRTPLAGLLLQLQGMLRRLERGDAPPLSEMQERIRVGTEHIKGLAQLMDELTGSSFPDQGAP